MIVLSLTLAPLLYFRGLSETEHSLPFCLYKLHARGLMFWRDPLWKRPLAEEGDSGLLRAEDSNASALF